jgi:HSP20 family protein
VLAKLSGASNQEETTMERKELARWPWGKTMLRDMPPMSQTFESLHREMNRLFDEFMPGTERHLTASGNGFLTRVSPAIDEAEDEKAYYVTAELPGMDEKDIDISLADNVLTIQGEKKLEKEEKEKNYHMIERAQGAFRRVLALPSEIDENKVEASFRKGVLSITLPKSKEAQAKEKHIKIKAA